jgi:hypothetical protein
VRERFGEEHRAIIRRVLLTTDKFASAGSVKVQMPMSLIDRAAAIGSLPKRAIVDLVTDKTVANRCDATLALKRAIIELPPEKAIPMMQAF